MKKTLIALSLFTAFSANALDVVLTQNNALIQDSGVLKDSGFAISEDGKIVNVDQILETNIPNTFYFKIEDQNASSIFYDSKTATKPFNNSHLFYSFISDRKGQEVFYQVDENIKTVKIFNVQDRNIFLEDEKGVFLGDLTKIKFKDDFFNQKSFNLKAFFDKEVTENDKFQYFYVANGFQWFPQYTMTLKEDNTLDFVFYANINNNTNSDLSQIDLTLMANEQRAIRHVRNTSIMEMATFSAKSIMADEAVGVTGSVSASDVEDLTAYKIDGKVDLNAGITSNVLVKSFDDVKYDKFNYVRLPVLNEYSIKNNRISDSKVTGISQTILNIDYKKNPSITQDLLPNGGLKVLKESIDEKGKQLLLPYSESQINGVKKSDLEINIPLNKNLKYSAKVLSYDYVENKIYKIFSELYFENNGTKEETFVTYLTSDVLFSDKDIPREFDVEYIKEKAAYRLKLTVPAGENTTLRMKTKLDFRR